MSDAKRHAPATLRNREPLREVLARVLPRGSRVLEVASGSGEHAIYFAQHLAVASWQPSDPDADARASIDAHRAATRDAHGGRCLPAIALDAMDWRVVDAFDAVVCINMIHISPFEASEGLFAGAASVLSAGAPLVTYGPYRIDGEHTAESNVRFEAWLHSLDPRFGVRDLGELEAAAVPHGLTLEERVPMPANNFTLVWRRA